jgi:fructose-specific component phosphotransferase system IIB-like protein
MQQPARTRRADGKPETEADRRFFDQQDAGYTGPLRADGRRPDPDDPHDRWAMQLLEALRQAQPPSAGRWRRRELRDRIHRLPQTAGPSRTGDEMSTDVATTGVTGESYTHRAWLTQAQAVLENLQQLQAAVDAQLAALTGQDAGESQLAGTREWLVLIGDAVAHGQRLIEEVDTAQRPVGEAVAGAGGVREVTKTKDYYAEGR